MTKGVNATIRPKTVNSIAGEKRKVLLEMRNVSYCGITHIIPFWARYYFFRKQQIFENQTLKGLKKVFNIRKYNHIFEKNQQLKIFGCEFDVVSDQRRVKFRTRTLKINNSFSFDTEASATLQSTRKDEELLKTSFNNTIPRLQLSI